MKSHDALDSLIYLLRALPLGWVAEELGERFGYEDENKDVAELVKVLDACSHMVEKEARRHYDGRKTYSTGVPFERVCRYPATEPGTDGGEEPVIREAHVQMYPNGTPKKAPHGGVWVERAYPWSSDPFA